MADRYRSDIKPFLAISLLVVMLLGVACAGDVERPTETVLSADTVLLNGKIITGIRICIRLQRLKSRR